MRQSIQILIILSGFLSIGAVYAQNESWNLKIKGLEKDDSKSLYRVYKSLQKNTYANSDSARAKGEAFLLQCQKKGFWEAQLQNWRLEMPNILEVELDLGPRYEWEALYSGNLRDRLAQQSKFSPKSFKGQLFDQEHLEDEWGKILRHSEQNGFPFAEVRLDSLQLNNRKIKAQVFYQSGPKIRMDTLQIEGENRLSSVFLARYLGILPGQLFDQRKIDRIPRLLKQLPYLVLEAAPDLNFRLDRAFPHLIIRQKKANEVNGVLGFLPNENTRQERSLLLTGSFYLSLQNLFNRGIQFRGEWESPQISSQKLEVDFYYPLIFKTNLSLGLSFDLLRQDSLFLNRRLGLELAYRLGNGGSFQLSLEDLRSTLGESNLFRDLESLPDVSEGNYVSIGLGYEWNTLDDPFVPHRGTFLDAKVQVGNRRLGINPFVPDSLYEGLALNSTQLKIALDGGHLFKIKRNLSFLTQMRIGLVDNAQLFRNDLLRLGGINNLRGQAENAFYVSSFLLGTAELRWFFETESYFLFFYDQAWIEEAILSQRRRDQPWGLGLGIHIGVKTGTFRLIYALGGSENQAAGLNRSKIHFGLLSRF